MKISKNIVANCSDFVWSLEKSNLDEIKNALRIIVKATNFKIYAKLGFITDIVYIPVTPDDIKLIEYEEEYEGGRVEKITDLGVDFIKILQKVDSTITESNYKDSDFYKKYRNSIENEFRSTMGNIGRLPVHLADINHLPNEDGVILLKGHSFNIRDMNVTFDDGYGNSNTLIIREDQPGPQQLRAYGDIMRAVGGRFYHNDGGYSQADNHREWFEENGYGDILELESDR